MVGYSGGETLNPTYRSIQDHTEAVLVEFDPTLVSYEDILLEWSQMHTPTMQRKTQYKSAIWFLNKEQEETAKEVVEGMKASLKRSVYTDVVTATRFYRAEEYHQDFLSKRGSNVQWA